MCSSDELAIAPSSVFKLYACDHLGNDLSSAIDVAGVRADVGGVQLDVEWRAASTTTSNAAAAADDDDDEDVHQHDDDDDDDNDDDNNSGGGGGEIREKINALGTVTFKVGRR